MEKEDLTIHGILILKKKSKQMIMISHQKSLLKLSLNMLNLKNFINSIFLIIILIIMKNYFNNFGKL